MKTTSEFQISEAQSGDAEAINQLVNSAYRGESSKQGWTTEADFLGGQRIDTAGVLEIMKTPNSKLLLAHDSEKNLAGCVHLKKTSDQEAYLGMLTVKPTLQDHGLGQILLKASENWAKKENCESISMTVIAQRPELIQWYERHAYVKTNETSPFPYDNPRFGIPLRQDLYFVVLKKRIS